MAEFYQKVKQEIEKGISTVSIRSKEVMEDMKIKKQVETLEDQFETAKSGLGQMVYGMFGQNNFSQEQIVENCKVIGELEQQLQDKKQELNQLHREAGTALGKTYCSRCKTEIPEGHQYCGQCGEKAPEPNIS
ncbi:MAG TPA: hypothetical protein DDW65_25195 [Firmicutes bacterium]|jgi:hypothetical protein|nr:hypothetical protein [Bacillota bacterium]